MSENNNSKVLVVKNLVKQFAGKTILDNISFSLKSDEIVGLIGDNGAGKTTIIHILLSILKPTSGQIYYFNQDFFKNRSSCLENISFASSYIKLPGKLTVFENLDVYGQIYNLNKLERKEKIEKYLKYFDLWSKKDIRIETLSSGQIMKVIIAKAFLTNPKIILLDEPTASLDIDTASYVREFIKTEQKLKKNTILLTSHNRQEIEMLCDRKINIKSGIIHET